MSKPSLVCQRRDDGTLWEPSNPEPGKDGEVRMMAGLLSRCSGRLDLYYFRGIKPVKRKWWWGWTWRRTGEIWEFDDHRLFNVLKPAYALRLYTPSDEPVGRSKGLGLMETKYTFKSLGALNEERHKLLSQELADTISAEGLKRLGVLEAFVNGCLKDLR